MNDIPALFPQVVALTNCDQEPVHIPGAIQPHGILFVLQEPHLTILQVSNNTFELLGIHPQQFLGNQFKNFLEAQLIQEDGEALGGWGRWGRGSYLFGRNSV